MNNFLFVNFEGKINEFNLRGGNCGGDRMKNMRYF